MTRNWRCILFLLLVCVRDAYSQNVEDLYHMPFLPDLFPATGCDRVRERNHTFIFIDSLLSSGDRVHAFTQDGLCAGVAMFNNRNFAVAVWGDDNITPEKDGFLFGERVIIIVERGENIRLFEPTKYRSQFPGVTQPLNYAPDGITIIEEMEPIAAKGLVNFSKDHILQQEESFVSVIEANNEHESTLEALYLSLSVPENIEITEIISTIPNATVVFHKPSVNVLNVVVYNINLSIGSIMRPILEIVGRIQQGTEANMVLTYMEGAIDTDIISPAILASTQGEQTLISVLRGDVDGDGIISARDVLQIAGYIVGLVEFNELEGIRADAYPSSSPDGKINILDLWTAFRKAISN